MIGGKRLYTRRSADRLFSELDERRQGVIALLREVIDDGLEDIGLTYDDIVRLNEQARVACFVGNFIGEYFVDQGHLGALLTEVHPAFYGVPSSRYEAAWRQVRQPLMPPSQKSGRKTTI